MIFRGDSMAAQWPRNGVCAGIAALRQCRATPTAGAEL
jgi:hypothetical protein